MEDSGTGAGSVDARLPVNTFGVPLKNPSKLLLSLRDGTTNVMWPKKQMRRHRYQ